MTSECHDPVHDPAFTYFTCTLGEAAILNAKKPHPFQTVPKLLDHLARFYPKTGGVGFFHASEGDIDDTPSIYSFELMREIALQTAARVALSWDDAVNGNRAVALVGKSTEDFFFTWLGLVTLGYKVLLLSPDLDADAIAHLCNECGTSRLIYDPHYQSLVANVNKLLQNKGKELKSYPLIDAIHTLDNPGTSEIHPVWPIPEEDVAYYHHSSGTSGLPKLLPVSHKMAIGVLPGLQTDDGMHATFSTTPMYHGGPADCFRAWSAGSLIWLYPGALPVTAVSIGKCIDAAKFTEDRYHKTIPKLAYFSCVPQILASLTEHSTGLTILANMRMVGVGGAAMPEQLGSELVQKGVKLVSRFGSTECGFLLSSHRSYESDKDWQYLRHNPMVDSISFEPREGGLHELIALNTWPAFAKTNRPDGSFATSDLFEPHTIIPNAWKYHSRADSQITLVTGKKFDPVPYEDSIRENPFLDDIFIFGNNRHVPGALLFPSAKASHISSDEFLTTVFVMIKEQNARVPRYAQLARSMLRIVSDRTLRPPKSSKGTTLRPKAEALCQKEIELAYSEQKSKDPSEHESSFDVGLDDNQVTQKVLDIVKDTTDQNEGISMTDDLYNQGVDSNDCIKIISNIQKRLLPPKSRTPPNDMVYTCGNIINLASHVIALRKGTIKAADGEAPDLLNLVSKYSKWKHGSPQHLKSEQAIHTPDSKQVILLTGATGALGAHILSQMRTRSSVGEIHCLIRAKDETSAEARLQDSLSQRQLPQLEESNVKMYSHPCKFSEPELGLPKDTYADLIHRVTHIIHAAWPVNFALRLESFVKESIAGLHHLIQFALSTGRTTPPQFVFCSSTASVLRSPTDLTVIPESILSDTQGLSPLGYSQSKWVAEAICDKAHSETSLHNHISVLRIGQLCGDTRNGVWNDSEAFPLMISSSKATGCFPRLPTAPLSWLPFDIAAAAVLDIANLSHGQPDETENRTVSPCRVYNMLESSPQPTTDDLVKWVTDLSPSTNIVSLGEWIARLEGLKEEAAEHPALKLLNFWRQVYTGSGNDANDKPREIAFATENTLRASLAMKEHTPIGGEQFGLMWRWIRENVGR